MKECWHDRRTQSCRDLHEPEMQCVHLDCKAIANPWVLVPDPEMGSDSGSLLRRSVQLLPCVWVEWTESRALPARFLRPCCDVVLSVWNVLVSVSTFFTKRIPGAGSHQLSWNSNPTASGSIIRLAVSHCTRTVARAFWFGLTFDTFVMVMTLV